MKTFTFTFDDKRNFHTGDDRWIFDGDVTVRTARILADNKKQANHLFWKKFDDCDKPFIDVTTVRVTAN